MKSFFFVFCSIYLLFCMSAAFATPVTPTHSQNMGDVRYPSGLMHIIQPSQSWIANIVQYGIYTNGRIMTTKCTALSLDGKPHQLKISGADYVADQGTTTLGTYTITNVQHFTFNGIAQYINIDRTLPFELIFSNEDDSSQNPSELGIAISCYSHIDAPLPKYSSNPK